VKIFPKIFKTSYIIAYHTVLQGIFLELSLLVIYFFALLGIGTTLNSIAKLMPFTYSFVSALEGIIIYMLVLHYFVGLIVCILIKVRTIKHRHKLQ